MWRCETWSWRSPRSPERRGTAAARRRRHTRADHRAGRARDRVADRDANPAGRAGDRATSREERFFIGTGAGASRLHSSDARCDGCRHRFGLAFDADVGYVISGRVALVLGFAIRKADVVDDRVDGFDLAGVGSATAGVEVALQPSTWIQAGAGIGMFDFAREAEGGSISGEDGGWLVTRVSAATELVTFDSVALTAALTVDGYLQGDDWAVAPMLGLSIRYSNLVVVNPFSGDGRPCNFDPSKGCRGHGDE